MQPVTTAREPETRTATNGARAAAIRGVMLSFAALAFSLVACCLLREIDAWPSRMSIGVLFGFLTSALTILLGNRTRLHGRAAAITSLASLGWLPSIFLMLAFSQEPIVITHWRCGTGVLAYALTIAVFVPVPLLISSYVAQGARFPELDRWLRRLTLAALVLVGLATTIGLSRIHRPDPDTYRASLPIVRALALGDSFVLGDGTTVTYRRVDGLGAVCAPSGGAGCCSLEGPEGFAYGGAYSYGSTCAPLSVRHDEKEDVWIVDDEVSQPRAFALKGTEKRSRDIQNADVARSIAPPIAWTFGGFVGSVLGVLFFVSAVRLERRRASLDALEGILGEDGWVKLEGRPPVRLASTAAVAPGPIVVRVRGGRNASYREGDGGTVVSWRPGTLEEARTELQGRVVSRYAFALTSALLCAAPLLLSGLGGSR